jgi:hypothetical protein
MPLPVVKTEFLIRELETDGHRTMQFLCSDQSIYYCKYRISTKKEEIDFLSYEVVCNYLLSCLNIPSPTLALVEIQENSYDPADLKYNGRYVRPGTICVGSKEIPGADLIVGIMETDKKQFNKLANPDDLIRIAAFDLLVDNIDRGRNENYNLLLQSIGSKNQIVPIDHAFAFGGGNGLRSFTPQWPVLIEDRLIQTTFFRSVVRFINPERRLDIAYDCLNLLAHECPHQISNAFADFPAFWEIPPLLEQRMTDFLTDSTRLDEIKESVARQLKAF